MAGIYIHIPFCKKACHYCDFHFSTSRQQETAVIAALHREIILRKDFLHEPVQTIYFGGGTPSLLSAGIISDLLDTIRAHFKVGHDAEITLEANPDDINSTRALAWKNLGINRISLGVQSFDDRWLQWMNRAHHADQSRLAIQELQTAGFTNISIDLIFGMPEQTVEAWRQDIATALEFQVPHLSCYALTPEPQTALWYGIEKGEIPSIDGDVQAQMFLVLMEELEKAGYEHYEISNFALPGKRSRHNSAYWKHIPYLGIGPSAHSFDGKERFFTIKNNTTYWSQIKRGHLPLTVETLSPAELWNEYILISLRTREGIQLKKIEEQWGDQLLHQLLRDAENGLSRGLLQLEEGHLFLTQSGRLLADQLAAQLFQMPSQSA